MSETKIETVADELRQAATLLRKRGAEATPGPWTRPLNTRWKATVRAALPEGEQGEWRDGIDPDTGQRELCTVVKVQIWSDGRHYRKRSGRDLEWIALMDPEVAEPLASWLESEAARYSRDVYLEDVCCNSLDQCEPLCSGYARAPIHDGCGCLVGVGEDRCGCFDHALAVARALNGATR